MNLFIYLWWIASLMLFFTFPLLSLPLYILSSLFLKNKKICIFLISFPLGILAYNFIPGETSDLYRHYVRMSAFEYMDFQGFIKYLLRYGNYLAYLHMYLISKLHNYNLYPFTVVVLFYAIVLNFFYEYKKKLRLKKGIFLFLLLVFFSYSYFYFITNNMRQPLAFSIFLYGLYKEQKKKNGWIYFIISLFIHQSILPLIIFILIIKLGVDKFFTKLLVLWGWYIPIISFIFLKISYLNKFTSKLILYYNSEDVVAGTFYTKLIRFTFVTISFILINFLSHAYKGLKKNQLDLIFKFAKLYLFFCIGAIPILTIFDRYSFYLSIFMTPLYFFYFVFNKKKSKKYILLLPLMGIICVGILHQWSAARNFSISSDFFRLLFKNVFVVFIK